MGKEIRISAESRGEQMWMVVRFTYDPAIVTMLRKISGGRYSRMEKNIGITRSGRLRMMPW